MYVKKLLSYTWHDYAVLVNVVFFLPSWVNNLFPKKKLTYMIYLIRDRIRKKKQIVCFKYKPHKSIRRMVHLENFLKRTTASWFQYIYTLEEMHKTCDRFFPKENHTSGLRSFSVSAQVPIVVIVCFLNWLGGMWTRTRLALKAMPDW